MIVSRQYFLALGLIVLTALYITPSTAFAQDISGNYTLDVQQDPGASDCVWRGSLTLVQSGGNPGSFTGDASVTVVSGPCLDFSGSVSGSINGSNLTIGVGVSGVGTATFTGMVTGPDNIAGTWSGLGLTGTWAAARAMANSIPATPLWLLSILALTLPLIARRFLQRV